MAQRGARQGCAAELADLARVRCSHRAAGAQNTAQSWPRTCWLLVQAHFVHTWLK